MVVTDSPLTMRIEVEAETLRGSRNFLVWKFPVLRTLGPCFSVALSMQYIVSVRIPFKVVLQWFAAHQIPLQWRLKRGR